MKSIGVVFLLPVFFGMLTGCSQPSPTRSATGDHASSTRASTAAASAAPGDSPIYPYDLWIGRALNHVEREAQGQRITLDFIRWSDSPYGAKDALFRVTNPGARPILVWNVRQQVSVPRSDRAASSWETRENDYPGRGWETATIPAGGSIHFPVLSPTEGDWRVCLLYSRELPDSQPPNRRFGGTYESIGPTVREP